MKKMKRRGRKGVRAGERREGEEEGLEQWVRRKRSRSKQAPTADVDTSTPGRLSAGSALMASATAVVVAILERLISALWAALHLVAIGSPVVHIHH